MNLFLFKSNSNCKYSFPIALIANDAILFVAIPIGKVQSKNKFGPIEEFSENKFSVCTEKKNFSTHSKETNQQISKNNYHPKCKEITWVEHLHSTG